jgi:hypothetical protein
VSKLHIKEKIIKRNAYNHIIDFKFFIQQKHVPIYENTFSLGEFNKNQIIQKIQSLEILKERVTRQKNNFSTIWHKNYV